jgi:DNA polymerase I-like protein with 3'-5' exonuclease and polymerase domains
MRVTILDVENSVTYKEYEGRDGKIKKHTIISPYSEDNYLVSLGLYSFDDTVSDITDEDVEYFCFQHNEEPATEGGYERVQEVLDNTDLLVAHNSKHEIAWLDACGLKYKGATWCTMIAEYILLRGQSAPLKLKALAEKYRLPQKKTDLTEEYLSNKVGFEAMPWDDVVEPYGRGDIVTGGLLYLAQVKEYDKDTNKGLLPTLRMMNEFTYELAEMEKNGLPVDVKALQEVKAAYIYEHNQLRVRLMEMAQDAVGDTPVSLTSNDFMSKLLYSREIRDKEEWKDVFNIKKDDKKRDLPRTRMNPSQFNKAVRSMSTIFQKTSATHCKPCKGKGWIHKVTIKGVPYKKMPTCKDCGGVGVVYKPTGHVAGFMLVATSPRGTSASGFSCDADTLASLASGAIGDAREFMAKYARYNAVSFYLSTFVEGIERRLDIDDVLHTSLNQCVAATGRLSSSGPNLQNMPRGNTFPIRRAIVSRFPGGSIMKADFSQLEFRVAGYLSKCPVVLYDVSNGVDVHSFTRDTINAYDNEPDIDRQDAKPDTFKPLYGGMSGTPRQVAYYKAFMKKYGFTAWHDTLLATAVEYKRITLPSGRQYDFPGAVRTKTGYVKYTTQIVNYPVQGFATGDLVPLACIAVGRLMRLRSDLKSLVILTVHDDIEIDVYPGEEDEIAKILEKGMLSIPEMCMEFYGFELEYPLEIEISIGENLMEQTEIGKFSR